MNKTNCAKCLFSDFADSGEPCKFNIIDKIKDYHKIGVENKFYYIDDYICRYGFSLEKYKQHKEQLGSIDQLEQIIQSKARLNYYLVINLIDKHNLYYICQAINSMDIIPKYISILMYDRNDTKEIIEILRTNITVCEWKIHNFLENDNLNHMISTVFDTHAFFNETSFFWINNDDSYASWDTEIQTINRILLLEQQACNALFRSNKDNDGLFLSFELYNRYREHVDKDLFKAIASIENTNIIYYGE